MDNECDRAPIEIPRSPNRDFNSRHLPVCTVILEKWYNDSGKDPMQTIANQTTTHLIMAIIQIT